MRKIIRTNFAFLFMIQIMSTQNAFSGEFLEKPSYEVRSYIPVPQYSLQTSERNYSKIVEQFQKLSCSNQTEKNFLNLYKKYSEDSKYIPILPKGVDIKAIEKNIDQFQKKIQWIEEQNKKIKSFDFSQLNRSIKSLEKNLSFYQQELGAWYKKYSIAETTIFLSQLEERKDEKVFAKLQNLLDQSHQIRLDTKNLLEQLSFFRIYPDNADLYLLRRKSEELKVSMNELERKLTSEQRQSHKEWAKLRHKKHSHFFYRRIVEQGAWNHLRNRSDFSDRALFQQLYISLEKELKDKEKSFLQERERYDLQDVLEKLKKWISVKKITNHYNEINNKWIQKNKEDLAFYKELLQGKDDQAEKKIDQIFKDREYKRHQLEDFVKDHFRKVYLYWMAQSLENQFYYVFDTILLNEVGGVDYPDRVESRLILQVLANRLSTNFYTQFYPYQALFEDLKFVLTPEQISKQRVLNLMFKEGEFSFTYYFIEASVRVFCPSQTKNIKKIRHDNFRMIWEFLKNPRPAESSIMKNTPVVSTKSDSQEWFQAMRYYSRISMTGRIEIDQAWPGFFALPETPGQLIRRDERYWRWWRQGRFSFLYAFQYHGSDYFVLELNGEKIVKERSGRHFFRYRSPHEFKYYAIE